MAGRMTFGEVMMTNSGLASLGSCSEPQTHFRGEKVAMYNNEHPT